MLLLSLDLIYLLDATPPEITTLFELGKVLVKSFSDSETLLLIISETVCWNEAQISAMFFSVIFSILLIWFLTAVLSPEKEKF